MSLLKKIVLASSKYLIVLGIVTSVSYTLPSQSGTGNTASDIDLESYEEARNTPNVASKNFFSAKKIVEIAVVGNKHIATDTILSGIPYLVGDIFKQHKSRSLITKLYGMKVFRYIKLEAEDLNDNEIKLIVTVREKTPVSAIVFQGNSNVTKEDFEKKIKFSEIKMLTEDDLPALVEQMKKLYVEKNYHHAQITAVLEDESTTNTARLLITIVEGKTTHVQRVFFTGNTQTSSRQLRTMTFTREDWLFGFANKAGTFQPDALEYDKGVIENYYHNNGYITARVTQTKVDEIPCSSDVNVTFVINEGDCYTIKTINAPGNSLLSEEEICSIIPLRAGQIYSKEAVRNTLETLRMMWGEYGYIYATVQPSVIPDLKTKTVAITFYTDLGPQMTLNRLTIIGNTKTCDRVIRRQLLFDEGEILTTRKLELSKDRVQALGFFDQKTGVNWKILKLNEAQADLELMLQEVKTGQLFIQMGIGGVDNDMSSPSESFRVSAGVQDSNFFGQGIQGSLSASYSKQDRSIDIKIANPWLFNRPLYGSSHFYHRRSRYDEFRGTTEVPSETTTGASGSLGVTLQRLYNSNALFELGFENIEFNKIESRIPGLEPLFKVKFQSGKLLELGFNLVQDMRNHPTMPTRGYIWNMATRCGIPMASKRSFGFVKWETDFQWFTPLINEYDLVLRIHGFLGLIKNYSGHTIPYRELYHIGGPSSVRGFTFGQIGPILYDPKFEIADSLGGKKACIVNVELMFPITYDGSIRGALFYDGGAGWDTPNLELIPPAMLRNNQFNFRHAVGFGIRLTQPTPVRVDVGFKLDRKKRFGESLSEVHFSMTRDF